MAKRLHQNNVPDPSKTKGKNHCGTITVMDQIKMNRSASRDAEIASGINPTNGCGAHGGNKLRKRRKARHQGKLETRKLSGDW